MKGLFWLTLFVSALLAVVAGFYGRYWLGDVYPLNFAFWGQRFTIFVALTLATALSALIAASILLRQAWSTAAGQARAGDRQSESETRITPGRSRDPGPSSADTSMRRHAAASLEDA